MASRAGQNEIHVTETNVRTLCFDVRTRLYEIWFDAAEMDMSENLKNKTCDNDKILVESLNQIVKS